MTEKKTYYTQAQNKATQKYRKEHMEEVRFWVRKGERALLQEEARQAGDESATQYIIKAINDRAGKPLLSLPGERDTGRSDSGE